MFLCDIWLFDWYFPQFCTSDMSKYEYLEVFRRVPSTSRSRESTVFCNKNCTYLCDIILVCLMMSNFISMTLDSVTSFSCIKDL